MSEFHDAIRDASAMFVIENGLLADQLADHQQLLIALPSGGQKAATSHGETPGHFWAQIGPLSQILAP